MNEVTVNGQVMWEDNNGERLKNPNEKPNMHGWQKVCVDGLVMWESPDGERQSGGNLH